MNSKPAFRLNILKSLSLPILVLCGVLHRPAIAQMAGSQAFDIPAQYQTLANDERAFLKRLGFEDFAMEAAQTAAKLKAKNAGNPIVPKVLEYNEDRFLVVSVAREFGVLSRVALEKAKARGIEAQALEMLTNLSAYHLMPFPLLGLEGFPESVFQHKMGPPARALRKQYLTERAQNRFLIEKQALMGTYLQIFFSDAEVAANGRDVKALKVALDWAANEVLKTQYEFSGLQQSRYLGRALTASLLRYSRAIGNAGVETNLRAKLAAEGVVLENHITSTLTFKNREGDARRVRVYSGDVANEYSTSSGAYEISVAVAPGPHNREQAQKYNLLGNVMNLPTLMSKDVLNSATEKRWSNQALQDDEARVLEEVWNPAFVQGFSHAGITEVRSDSSSGISMVWIWDVYPHQNMGGVRFQTPENFAYAERFNSIGFVHYNPLKVFVEFKKQIQERGYKSIVWESFGSKLIRDSKGKDAVALDSSRRVARKSKVSEETVMAWMKLPDSEAERWYYNEVVPRAMAQLRGYFTGEEAVVFSHGFKNRESSAYCTQLILWAYLQGANLDYQAEPDEWRGTAKVAAMFGNNTVTLNERIIAPSGFAWQQALTETVFVLNLDRSRVHEQMISHPALNGQPTVADRRLQLLHSNRSLFLRPAGKSALLTGLNANEVYVYDDNL